MDSGRLMGVIVTVGVILLAFGGLWAGWRALRRTQAGIVSPESVPAEIGERLGTVHGLHAASTFADEPLRRIAVRGLGFRARAAVTLTRTGLILELRGAETFFIPAGSLREVRRASWAIDKGVETDGLTVIAWTLGDTDIDTYLRLDGDDGLVLRAPELLGIGEGGR